MNLDHTVIHIADWERSNRFYKDVLGAELVANPEGAANPLGAWAYRFGDQQLNVHGPWPGQEGTCCPPPLNEPGRSDLCFVWPGTLDEARRHLEQLAVEIEEGPVRRFGAQGWGLSLYIRDPDGSEIELISYRKPADDS